MLLLMLDGSRCCSHLKVMRDVCWDEDTFEVMV